MRVLARLHGDDQRRPCAGQRVVFPRGTSPRGTTRLRRERLSSFAGGISLRSRGRRCGWFGAFVKAGAIGDQFSDIDLVTLARQGQGRALIRQGEVARGVSLLDEAMV